MKKFSELVGVDVKRALHVDNKVRQVIAQVLPTESVTHLQFCRIENKTLKVTLDNASWLARLRFSARQIIDELARENIIVTQITWHVSPETTQAQPRHHSSKPRARSDSSARIVGAAAQAMEKDELQSALMKIAEQLAKHR